MRLVWQEICNLSLRQRRSLLLHSQELIIYLLQSGVGDQEIAEILELTESEWAEIKMRLPLSDFQIADLSPKKNSGKSVESSVNSIKKARHEARSRLQKLAK